MTVLCPVFIVMSSRTGCSDYSEEGLMLLVTDEYCLQQILSKWILAPRHISLITHRYWDSGQQIIGVLSHQDANYYNFEVIGSGTWVQTNSEQWSGPGAQAHNSNLLALFASSNLDYQHQQPARTQDTNSFLVSCQVYWLRVLGLLHFNIIKTSPVLNDIILSR